MTAAPHIPVLRDRVVEIFRDAPDGVIVDATLGAGGHARAIAQARRSPGEARAMTVVGIDRDPAALESARASWDELDDVTLHAVQARFDELEVVLENLDVGAVAGVLFDLGVSSMQLDAADRGFAYRYDGPLDMRMDPSLPMSADDLVNASKPSELLRVLQIFGQERFAARIVRAIVDARPITSTGRLADVVRLAIPAAARRTGGHPATRTFQALRIAVNGELESIERALPLALDRLVVGGVCAVVSYHSLEDRIVAHAFAEATRGCVCPPDMPVCGCGRTPWAEYLTRRGVVPSEEEVARNPRARSARLRAVRRIAGSAR